MTEGERTMTDRLPADTRRGSRDQRGLRRSIAKQRLTATVTSRRSVVTRLREFTPARLVRSGVRASTRQPTSVAAADGPDVDMTDRTLGIVAVEGARLPWKINAAILEFVFLLGLGGVFLANAAVAVVEPAGFRELVAACPIGGLIGNGGWVAPVVAINDSLIGAAVIAAHRFQGLRAPVLAWAGVWLLIITLMKLTTMG